MTICSNISQVDEDMQIYFDFGCHGWSDLLIVSCGKVSGFRISGVFTDAPESLLNLCDAVLENTALRVALYDEPGGIFVEVTPDAGQQHTVIFSIYEIYGSPLGSDPDEDGHLVMAVRLKRRRLIGMLMGELWKNHKFLSEPSYQRNRDNFPHTRLRETNDRWNKSALGPSFLM